MLRVQLSTLVFQILNFFLLLAVLTWFLYRPLLQAMRRREEEIAARLQDAEERAHRADAERAKLAQESQQARLEAEAVISRAQAEASQLRQRFLEQARQETARYMDEGRQRIEEQERAVRQQLEETVRRTAVGIAGTLIQKAAGLPFHRALVEDLLGGALTLEGAQGEMLRQALSRTNEGITVEMAYPPSPELSAQVREALTQTLGVTGHPRDVAFRVEASLLAGVRILVENVVVDLSLSRILAELGRENAGKQET
jgi:F-type H+-transporting ATPase subunit b